MPNDPTTLAFSALGTEWHIEVDGSHITAELAHTIQHRIARFERAYSRFRTNSWVAFVNRLPVGNIPVPQTAQWLEFGFQLATVTNNYFNPVSGLWQREHGYDESYRFARATTPASQQTPLSPAHHHHLMYDAQHQCLRKTGPAQLDVGAWGKGRAIDSVAEILRQYGHNHFLVDAGGDMFGTSKHNGSSWQIGLQNPFHPDEAIGVLSLKNQGFAASGAYHRQIGNYHHLLDGKTGVPIHTAAASFVVAPSAMAADGLATAYFVSPRSLWPNIMIHTPHQVAMVLADGTHQRQAHFPAAFFIALEKTIVL